MAAFSVGRAVAQLAVSRWMANRSNHKAPTKDLVELIRTGFPDEIKRRRVQRQFEDIADSVAERLLPYLQHEFRDLTDGDREAALHQVVLTLNRADLSDEALFADDLDSIKLSRRLRAAFPAREAEFQLGEAGARLYDVVLEECCDCLARIIIHLPQFGSRASAETLSRLSGVADQISAVLARLPARSLTAPGGTSDDDEFTRRYLTFISENLDSLDLFGVRFERFTRPQTTLSVAYISLNVSEEGGARHREPGSRTVAIADWRSENRMGGGAVRVEVALSDHRLTLVRGEAGGGKSTLLRWLAVMAARGTFTSELAEWNGCVPFVIKLRSHAGGALPRPEEFLDDVAGHLTGIMPSGWVHRQLISGRALLLVDGVDEVTSTQRQAVRQWLKALVNEFRSTRVIVTSRPAAATSDWLRAEGFATTFLEQLSPADMRTLVQYWHRAVRDSADLPCAPERLPVYEARMLARLAAAPHLRTLASTPLLAAMLCALNLDRETLPRDRMGLYAAALDLLLETRDAKRNIPSALEIQLQRDQKIRILQMLAWHLSLSWRVELPKPTVEQAIKERLTAMPGVQAHAPDVLGHLLQRSGVIREPIPGRIDFVHRTVQEYLTAKQVADLGDMELLIRNAHRDQWRETVIMAAGHANEPLRRELLEGLLSRVKAEPRRARQLKLLAVACLETLPSIPQDLREALNQCLDELVPPRSIASARSLAAAGEPVLARLPERLDNLSDAIARATIRTACLINGPEALNVLSRYGTDSRQAVQKELNDAWKYFDPQEFAECVLSAAPAGGRIEVLRSSGQLNALGVLAPLSTLYAILNEPAELGFLTRHAETLKRLTLMFDTPGTDINLLPPLPSLESIVVGLPRLSNLDFLDALPDLSAVWLSRCGDIEDFSSLRRYTNLRELGLQGSRHLTTLEGLPELRQLRNLGLNGSRLTCGLADVATAAPHLNILFLHNCKWVRDLTPLAELPLAQLELRGCNAVADLSPLSGLTDLSYLDLAGTQVRDVTPLSELTSLVRLNLDVCSRIIDLAPLVALTNLRILTIRGISPGIDLSPLAANRKLTVQVDTRQEIRGGKALGRRLKIS